MAPFSSRPSATLHRRYPYRPKWSMVLLGIGFFGGCAAAFIHIAHTDARNMHVGPFHVPFGVAAGAMWLLASLSALFVLGAAWAGVVYRFGASRFIEIREDALGIPFGIRRPEMKWIPYETLLGVRETRIGRWTMLLLASTSGQDGIAPFMLPSEKDYRELRDFLLTKVPGRE